VECQGFERDGGGGSATILRRFGSYPAHDMPSGKVLDEMRRASAALAAVEDVEAAKSVEFAKWWLDLAIPTKVKTFMMITARVQALVEVAAVNSRRALGQVALAPKGRSNIRARTGDALAGRPRICPPRELR
jgi:hypothetical protein